MCGVNQTEDLPPLYHELAAHKKNDGTTMAPLGLTISCPLHVHLPSDILVATSSSSSKKMLRNSMILHHVGD
jgi:hypothetical protein